MRESLFPRRFESLYSIGGDVQEPGGLAGVPSVTTGFFVAWVAVGVTLGLVLVARGHDARTMVTLGVGLGPIMVVVTTDTIRRRDPAAEALILERGIDHGGPIDVLVLAQGEPEDVASVWPSVAALRSELGTLTVARAVAYEWLEGDADNEVVTASRSALADAANRLPVQGAGLALWPGTVASVAARFRREHAHGLVLLATVEAHAGTAASG